MAGPEVADAGAVGYTERLWLGPWVWVVAAGGVAALAIAYGGAFGTRVGWVVALLGTALVVALVLRAAPRVVVQRDGLRAGRATMPWGFTGRVLALDGDQARTARGPQGDPSAYLLLRPGVGPGAVVIEVTDPQDPHRTWLLASRDPQRLARAIDGARGRLTP